MTKILNARILASLGMIVFVAAIVASSTGAFFSDTETSTGNTFTAGELDLTVDNSSYGFDWNDPTNEEPTGVWGANAANSWQLADLTNQLFFSFGDLKPGDYGEDTISLHVQNNAYACMSMDLTGTPENDLNEAESEGLPVDTTDGADEGELQNYLSFMFWHDDGDNVLEEGEDVIEELSGLPGTIFSGDWLAIAESGDEPLQAGETEYIGKGWCFGTMTATPETPAANEGGPTPGNTGFECDGEGNHNDAQTDGIVVDVSFYSVQSRNNAEFQCSDLNDDEEPIVTTLTLAKTVIPAELHPDNAYTLTASSTNTVTLISGVEGAGTVTNAAVLPGTYNLSESSAFPGAITTWSCSGNATPEVDNGNGTATVTIAAGESVGCNIVNDYTPQT